MACGHEERELIGDKPQPDKDRAAFPGFRQIGESGSRDVLAQMKLTYGEE